MPMTLSSCSSASSALARVDGAASSALARFAARRRRAHTAVVRASSPSRVASLMCARYTGCLHEIHQGKRERNPLCALLVVIKHPSTALVSSEGATF
eukprot:scaffold57378_cov61-Phaeocystis_antarctica.AAC.1